LQEWLIDEYRQGRNVVVAIDEAQCMSPATMERLRLLSNLETAEHKLIQVVLAGQPELEQKLAQPNLRQFRERIAVRAKIWPLNQSDSVAYINHRLSKVVQPGSRPIFTRLALKYLARNAGGNPRRLNILCDSALLAGFSYQKQPIPWRIAWEARNAGSRRPNWRAASVVRTLAVTGLIAATIGIAFFGSRMFSDRTSAMRSSAVGTILRQRTELSDAGFVRVPEITTAAVRDSVNFETQPIVAFSRDDHALMPDLPDTELTAKSITGADNGRASRIDFSYASETVVINQGDGLWQLCREIYGDVDAELVQKVIEANPHIPDPNNLAVGEEIVFPRLAASGEPISARVTQADLED
jgi:general secretion pathway protein A